MVQVNELISDSPLFTLANVSDELLAAEKRIPFIDLETPPRELSLSQDFKQPTEPSTPHQPTVNQLPQ